jgi:spore germination protein GerM
MPQEGLVGETKEVVLYFSDQAGEMLALETRAIAKVEGIARATVQELLAGPSVESGLLPTISVGTKLIDINVRPDGLCIVDFSSELVDNHPGGSLNEELTVYSIVNTLTQFPTIQEVQILVDGQKVESIAGHLDVSTTMARNNDIIEEW